MVVNLQKPQVGRVVNHTDPLVQGLVGAWLLNEGAGLTANDAAGRHAGTLAVPGLATTPQWKKNRYGTALSISNILQYVTLGAFSNIFRRPTYTTLSNFSFVLGYRRSSLGSGNVMGIRAASDEPLTGVWMSNTQVRFYVGSFDWFVEISPRYTTADVFAFVNGQDGTEIWQNGTLLGSTGSNSTTSLLVPYNNLVLGDWSTDTNNGIVGDEFIFLYVYDRTLCEEEIRALSFEPYMLFRPTRLLVHPTNVTYSVPHTYTGQYLDVVVGSSAVNTLCTTRPTTGGVKATGTVRPLLAGPKITFSGGGLAAGTSIVRHRMRERPVGGSKLAGAVSVIQAIGTFGGAKASGRAIRTSDMLNQGSGGLKATGSVRTTEYIRAAISGGAKCDGVVKLSMAHKGVGGATASGTAIFLAGRQTVRMTGSARAGGAAFNTLNNTEKAAIYYVVAGGGATCNLLGYFHQTNFGCASAMGGTNIIKRLEELYLIRPHLRQIHVEIPNSYEYRVEKVGGWCEINECDDKVLAPTTINQQGQYLPPKEPVEQLPSDQIGTES